jgi:hypothetical protein
MESQGAALDHLGVCVGFWRIQEGSPCHVMNSAL